jgi:hypothetical protein
MKDPVKIVVFRAYLVTKEHAANQSQESPRRRQSAAGHSRRPDCLLCQRANDRRRGAGHLNGVQKELIEGALGAELSHHLGYAAGV